MRNPQRTASTASALMIGLALVTLVGMLAASIRASFFDAVDKIWVTDYAVTAQNNYSPIPTSVSDPLREVPGTTAVVGVRAGEAELPRRNPLHHGRRPRREPGLPARVGRGLGRRHGIARRGRRVHRRQLRRGSQPSGRIARRGACSRTAARRPSRSRESSILRPEARRSAPSRRPAPRSTSRSSSRRTSSCSSPWRAA